MSRLSFGVVLQAWFGFLSGLGAAADRSVRTPTSFECVSSEADVGADPKDGRMSVAIGSKKGCDKSIAGCHG